MPINMSYCRFRNTLAALRECRDALDEYDETDRSEEEASALRKLLILCQQLAADYG